MYEVVVLNIMHVVSMYVSVLLVVYMYELVMHCCIVSMVVMIAACDVMSVW